MNTSSDRVIQTYESKITELEISKARSAETAAKPEPSEQNFTEKLELLLAFLSNY